MFCLGWVGEDELGEDGQGWKVWSRTRPCGGFDGSMAGQGGRFEGCLRGGGSMTGLGGEDDDNGSVLIGFEFQVIGTHNGTFHCDEALAVYLLRLTETYAGAGASFILLLTHESSRKLYDRPQTHTRPRCSRHLRYRRRRRRDVRSCCAEVRPPPARIRGSVCVWRT